VNFLPEDYGLIVQLIDWASTRYALLEDNRKF